MVYETFSAEETEKLGEQIGRKQSREKCIH